MLAGCPRRNSHEENQQARSENAGQEGDRNQTISSEAKGKTIVAVFATSSSGTYFPDGSVVPIGIYDASLPVWVVDSYDTIKGFRMVCLRTG